jgi:hypothetical protein
VQLPPDIDRDSVRRKLACDLYYFERLGPWLDLRLLIFTAVKMLGIPCAWPCSLLQIPNGAGAEDLYRGPSMKPDAAPTEIGP